MTGPEWYEKILSEEPGLLVHCRGRTIIIHVPTGTWVARGGLMGTDELFRKLVPVLKRSIEEIKATEGQNFFSRPIGFLTILRNRPVHGQRD